LLYMAYTFVNKGVVTEKFADELDRQGIRGVELYTSPDMFHNFLWSGIAVSADSIYLGEYSLFQDESEVDWIVYPRQTELGDSHPAQREVEVLKWFAQGKYFLVQEGENLAFYNVKWGRMDFTKTKPEEAIVFHYNIVKDGEGWKAQVNEGDMNGDKIKEALSAMYRRIWTKNVIPSSN
jgi:hypothetical protein